MSDTPSLLNQDSTYQHPLLLYMGASFLLHAAVMTMMIILSGVSGCEKRSFSDGVIHVDLVSLHSFADGGDGSGVSAAYQQPVVSRPESKAPVFEKPVAANRPVVSISDKAAPVGIKASFKKRTFDPQRIAAGSVDRPEARVKPESSEETLAGALSRLRRSVDDNQRADRDSAQVDGSGPPGRPGPGTGTGTGTGTGARRQALSALDIYNIEIRYHILNNWVYSERLAGNDFGLKAYIGITIAEDGRILDIWYDERSGNRYFDESIYKAVLKSDPLPRLPEGHSSYTVGLEFTPSDIKSAD